MTYVVKANALKRKVNEKSEEMKKLEETAKELIAKKRNLFDIKKLLLREILKIYMNHVLFGVELTTCSFTV